MEMLQSSPELPSYIVIPFNRILQLILFPLASSSIFPALSSYSFDFINHLIDVSSFPVALPPSSALKLFRRHLQFYFCSLHASSLAAIKTDSARSGIYKANTLDIPSESLLFLCGRSRKSRYSFNRFCNIDALKFPEVILLLTILLTNVTATGNDRKVRISIIAPENAHQDEGSLKAILPSVDLAVKNISNPLSGRLPNYQIIIQSRNSNCSATYGPLAAIELYNVSDVFLGPVCEYVIAPVARYAGVWGIPVITAGAQVDNFSFKKEYPTLTRMMGSYGLVGEALRYILHEFGWSVAGLLFYNYGISSPMGQSKCHFIQSAVYKALGQKSAHKSFNDTADFESFKSILEELSKSARIVVICANPLTVREILLAAEELNMVNSGEYVFFSIELFGSMDSGSLTPWYVKNDTAERNERAKKAYTALLTVTTRTPNNEAYRNFSVNVKKVAEEKYNSSFGNESLSAYATSFYDAVLLYALALNETLDSGGSKSNGLEVTRRMWNRTIQGITGDINIDENGDRIADYSLLDMDPETSEFKIVAHYIGVKQALEYVPGTRIHWPAGRNVPPPDTPPCGFDGSRCWSVPGYAVLSIILSSIVVILSIASFFIYRHYKLEAEIASMTWRVNAKDVIQIPPGGKFRGSMYSITRRNSQITVISEDAMSMYDIGRQAFINTAFYKGNKVAVKTLNRSRIEITRSLLLELKWMKDLHHDHLARFYGACLDLPYCCLLTEYCQKGSLEDILENDQIKLDWMFRYSLMHDIIKGMCYLHASDIKSHGALKSSNCVVDSRFVLKITDFGLRSLRADPESSSNGTDCYAHWRRLLWTAPELLRMQNPPPEGTQKGDVYSFAIIVHEIVTRQGPFYLGSNIDLSPKGRMRCRVCDSLICNHYRGLSTNEGLKSQFRHCTDTIRSSDQKNTAHCSGNCFEFCSGATSVKTVLSLPFKSNCLYSSRHTTHAKHIGG